MIVNSFFEYGFLNTKIAENSKLALTYHLQSPGDIYQDQVSAALNAALKEKTSASKL